MSRKLKPESEITSKLCSSWETLNEHLAEFNAGELDMAIELELNGSARLTHLRRLIHRWGRVITTNRLNDTKRRRSMA